MQFFFFLYPKEGIICNYATIVLQCVHGQCPLKTALILSCCPFLLSQKHGLVIIPEDTPNGDVSHESPTSGITVVKQEVAQVLESAGDGPLGESPNTLSSIFSLKQWHDNA